ncbi:MAG: hypothetical protein HYR55_18025 [Acidobacteria bacterium]|nr:hypothetical protein [Acidobacteriota bacterium]MBI3655427.1 hypothetical protein [Acidobacteriota bacterium]
MRNRFVGLGLISLLLLTAAPSIAQGPNILPTLSIGQEPYGSYLVSLPESINLYNGNVLASIPLISRQGRNGQDVVISATYNSKQIVKVQTGNNSWQYQFNTVGPHEGRWRISNQPYVSYTSNVWVYANDPRCTPPNTYGIYATPIVTWVGSDGSLNEMHRTDTDARVFETCAGTALTNYFDPGPYRSVNGAHAQFRGGSTVTNGVLYMKNGQRIDFSNASAIKAIDTNGNYITYNINNSGQTTSLVDNLNRSTNLTYDVNGNLSQITLMAANGQTQTYVFGYTTLHVNTYLSDCGAGVTGMHQDVTVLQSITLPNNLSYSFTYDQGVLEDNTAVSGCAGAGPAHNVYTSTLKLTKITYPEGAYTRYAYNYVRPTSAPDQIDKYVTAKYRNAQDGQGEQTWILSYTADGNGNITSTQINNPDSGVETHTFTGVLDTLVRYSVGGNYIKDIAQTWTFEPGDDGTPQPSCTNPATRHNPRITRRTTSVYQNNTTFIQSKVESDYDQQGYLTTTCTPNIQHINGNVIEKREYAFGNATPGSLLRRTDDTYLNSTGYDLNHAHILNRNSTQIIYNAGGILQSQTNYGYDESALTNATGATAHDDTNFGATYTTRGNQTSVSNLLSTPAPGSWLTTATTYDILGNRRQTTDPKSNLTTYSYTDSYSDGINRNTFAYFTSTTDALNQITSSVYNFNTGLVASTADPNNNVTSHNYNDIMNQETATNHPDGGQTTYSYNDIVANPGLGQYPSTTTTTKIDNSKNKMETRYFDGMKRVRQTVLNDPQGNVLVDTTYDNTSCGCGGSAASRSNPYRAGDTVYTTTTLSDTMCRVSEVRPTDWNPGNPTQNKLTYTYSVDMTNLVETKETIDPAGKKKKHGYDAFGRLVIAWEPDASGNYTLSTSYQYNILNKLTSVTQGGQT